MSNAQLAETLRKLVSQMPDEMKREIQATLTERMVSDIESGEVPLDKAEGFQAVLTDKVSEGRRIVEKITGEMHDFERALARVDAAIEGRKNGN
jgi:hypothetical protein|tara:strand:- start:6682 stop:6963 length:282 start_codon:yes stop_codon:yes gene_type:complete